MQTTKKKGFINKLRTMLSVDLYRIFTMPLFYITAGIAFVMPVLILVMTTMMDGSVTVNPQTGAQTTMQGFEHVWQIIGSLSGGNAMSMDLTGMCNINLIYFLTAVLVSLFVTGDFTSGYSKNLFTVRSDRTEYVVSKTVVCFLCGALLLIAFFIGAMVGGAIAGLPFAAKGVSAGGVLCSMLAKIFVMLVFVSIFVTASVIAKQRAWLAIVVAFAVGALLFTMLPMITPLDATILHVALSVAGGLAFGVGLGAVSRLLLIKIDVT